MAVNATMRPLKIPAKFVPYLEKHHIYDLFYEMTIALIKHRPEDTIQFLKNEMSRVRKRKGRLKKVILIAPQHIDIKKFADALADESTRVVTLEEIIEEYSVKKQESEPLYDPEELAMATKKHLDSKKFVTKGWILVDFPRTKDEAKALQRHCILPSHTLELIHNPKDYSRFDLWNEKTNQWSFESFHAMLVEYKRRAIELRRVYQSSYKRVIIRGRPFDKLVRNCKLLLRKMPYIGAPMLPRVVLIGPRGSRRRTIASMLNQRFKLVHVHFWTLISKARASDDNLGEEIRHTAESININICLELLEARLLEDDCMNHGWVLTGFPNDETDFEALDSIDVPPNRIVFLNVSNSRCTERLRDRQINIYSGEVMSKKGTADDTRMKEQLVTHPDDAPYNVEIEQEVFSAEIQGMLDYCQHRAVIIKASGPLNEVFEKVENVIINPLIIEKCHRTVEVSQSLYNQYHEDQSL